MPVVREVLDCRGGIVTAPALAAALGLGRGLSSVLPREVRDCAGCLPQAAAQPRQAHPTLKHDRCPNRLVDPEDAMSWSRETGTRGRSTRATGPQ
jgi:hypothetical protein